MGVSPRTYASILADFAVDLLADSLPPGVIRQAELCTLDFIGVALAGSRTASAAAAADYVCSMAGAAEATIFGSRTRVPLAHAALANGTMAHSIELDDHEAHVRSKVHPGVVVMPVAWSISETRPVSGMEFLTAVILGYDIIGRLSAATPYPNFLGRERGFHTTSLFGPFAGGITAGRLLGLSRGQLVQTLGIAGSLCSGLSETQAAGSWVKHLHAGWAAQAGVMAAQLAARGLTGPETVLEGKKGFFRAFCGDGNFDLAVIDSQLGVDFDISLIMYKSYACAGGIHPALTAVDELRRRTIIRSEDIAEVVVHTNQHVVESFSLPRETKCRPRTGAQAQFSLPYAVAALLVDGVALLDQFTDVAVQRNEIQALAERIRVCIDRELSPQNPGGEPCRVVIRLKDGRVLDATVAGGKGSLEVPMGERELRDKYHRLADPVIGSDRARAVEDRVLKLRSDKNVGDLPSWLYACETAGSGV